MERCQLASGVVCRRVLVMEWVTGVKLTGLPPLEIQRLVAAGQEAFLTQLLEIGFFHGDPHPGNLLKVHPINAKFVRQYYSLVCTKVMNNTFLS